MNLHAIASPVIAAVNPMQTVQLATGSTSTVNADFSRTANYTFGSVPAQIQALTGPEIRQIENIGVQGTKRAIYFYGNVPGLIRASQTNGTLVQFGDGSIWMVFIEFEPWNVTAGWSKVGVVAQQASVWPG